MNKAKYLVDQLTSFESEEIIANKLDEITLDEIGSKKFILHHSYITKLNMQVVKNILSGGEDSIMTQFIDYEKLKPLIKELFTFNVFKTKIYPLIKEEIAKLSSIKAYLCLYHEACVLNLLENFFFSITACQAAEDYIVDIIEYCYLHLSKYVNQILKEGKKESPNEEKVTPENLSEKIKKINLEQNSKEGLIKDLDEKKEEIEFNIAMCCINILRYISDHLEQLPFPVRHHMMNVKDVPMLFVTIMETKPWERNGKEGSIEIFENNNWNSYKNINNKLPKLEAQVWITIYNLFMVQENTKKYEINQYRQTQLLRLRKYFSDKLYDQIPQMTNFYRALEEMSLMNFNNVLTVNPFVVEMVPILSNSEIYKLSPEKYKEISYKIVNYFRISEGQLRKELEPVSEVYTIENMEYFTDDPKCANCGKDATSRCSRCKSEWYCSKECQVKRWKSHKEMCKVLSKLVQEEENEKKVKKGVIEEIINKEEEKKENKVLVEEMKEENIIKETKIEAKKDDKKDLDDLD